jgi:hypothetical protein
MKNNKEVFVEVVAWFVVVGLVLFTLKILNQ